MILNHQMQLKRILKTSNKCKSTIEIFQTNYGSVRVKFKIFTVMKSFRINFSLKFHLDI